MQFFLFLSLLIAVVLMIFAFQNSEIIKLKFLSWEFENPLSIISALAFTAGLVSGAFLSVPAWWRKTKTNRQHKKRIQELEKELSDFARLKDNPGFKKEQ